MTTTDAERQILAGIAGTIDGLLWRCWTKTPSNAETVHAHRAVSHGVPPGCQNRTDRQALESLREKRLVKTSGATSGLVAKLTPCGALAALSDDPERTLATVKRIQGIPETATPYKGLSVILGCEIIPSAGAWWAKCKSDKGWETYADEISRVSADLIAAWAAGFIHPYFSAGIVWAVTVTDAGQAPTLPDGCAPVDWTRTDRDTFDAAFDRGLRMKSTDTGSLMARRLPASKW